jgi:hypothetical protein
VAARPPNSGRHVIGLLERSRHFRLPNATTLPRHKGICNGNKGAMETLPPSRVRFKRPRSCAPLQQRVVLHHLALLVAKKVTPPSCGIFFVYRLLVDLVGHRHYRRGGTISTTTTAPLPAASCHHRYLRSNIWYGSYSALGGVFVDARHHGEWVRGQRGA